MTKETLHRVDGIDTMLKQLENKEIRWKTEHNLQIIEPVYRYPLQMGITGTMRVKVKDSNLVIKRLCNSNEYIIEAEVIAQLRAIIMMRIKNYMAQFIQKKMITIYEIESELTTCSKELKKRYEELLLEYGVELLEFVVEDVIKPEGDDYYEKFKEMHEQKKHFFEGKNQIKEENALEINQLVLDQGQVIRFEENKYCDHCGIEWVKGAIGCSKCSNKLMVTPSCKTCGYVFLRQGNYCPCCGGKRQ